MIPERQPTVAEKLAFWLVVLFVVAVIAGCLICPPAKGAEIKVKSECSDCPRTIIVTEPLTPGKSTVFYSSPDLINWTRVGNVGVNGTYAFCQSEITNNIQFFVSQTQ